MLKSKRIVDLNLDLKLNTPEERGRYSEDRVEAALQNLVELGQILCFIRSEVSGELDRQGIDFLVWPEATFIVPLQVKSSLERKEEHLSRFFHIPCVVVLDSEDDQTLCRKILRELSLSAEHIVPIQ